MLAERTQTSGAAPPMLAKENCPHRGLDVVIDAVPADASAMARDNAPSIGAGRKPTSQVRPGISLAVARCDAKVLGSPI